MRPALLAACAVLLLGCGSEAQQPSSTPDRPTQERPSAERSGRPSEPPPKVREARCPAGAANCENATGRVIYVEAVDPDGDGDAHFVLDSEEAVTGPGISVIDVRRELRPHPLPGPGDLLSAAGPVYRGSYGQRQIQAEVLRIAP